MSDSGFVFNTKDFEKGFKAWLKKWGDVDLVAKKEVGNKFIHDVSDGLEGNGTAPPILTGRLRGSGSAFVNGKAVADTTDSYPAGTPATGPIEKKRDEVVIFYNTEYAARWHENPFNPGPVSQAYGNTGPKYVEKHLKTDGPALFKKYADIMGEKVKN
jgi:hypothetical protein